MPEENRVRRICLAMPETSEKLSHGAPTFFAKKRTFAMFLNNHHGDGHIAVWAAAAPGEQQTLIAASPKTYFRPPYVGVKGWIGIELAEIDDEDLAGHLTDAWRLVMAAQGKSPAQRNPKNATRSPGGFVSR
jgi:hypothetical protein